MTRRAKTAAHAHFFAIVTAVGGLLCMSTTRQNESLASLYFATLFRFAAPTRSLAGKHLVFDPGVGLRQAVAQADGGLPAEYFLNERVVAVAAVDALGGVEVVVALELDAGDLFDDVDELVDGDQFAGAEVDGLEDVAVE